MGHLGRRIAPEIADACGLVIHLIGQFFGTNPTGF
jgi:hypothetical protein